MAIIIWIQFQFAENSCSLGLRIRYAKNSNFIITNNFSFIHIMSNQYKKYKPKDIPIKSQCTK